MGTTIAAINKHIARLEAQIQTIRARLVAIMAVMPDQPTAAENAVVIATMMRMMDKVGALHERIDARQREIVVIEQAGGNTPLLKTALRAVRTFNKALAHLGQLHRRGIHTGPLMDQHMAHVAAAEEALAAVMPIGGQAPPPPPPPPPPPGDPPAPPLPPDQPTGLFVATRDPRNLAADPMFGMMFDAFSCMVPHGSPPTPDELPPTFSVYREFRTVTLPMPDGQSVEFWGFSPANQPGVYPSTIIRVPEGALFHGAMKPRKGTHTIHWHGIEPTAMNDGVGKLSFEVDSLYTYQWFAAEPGSYFYHCHHNLFCGAYSLLVNRFRPATAGDAGLQPPAAALPGTIIAMDARTLGHGPFSQYSQEMPLPINSEFEMTAARRFDILFQPTAQHVGDQLFRAEFFNYRALDGQRGAKHVGALGIDGANALIRVLP
ncbi:MAG: hypothetical protein FJ291_06770 [Planctomycetes bacterium]|nr:hypothetical protein [Planctomycetota bacterium]